jgi:hypothetical protein
MLIVSLAPICVILPPTATVLQRAVPALESMGAAMRQGFVTFDFKTQKWSDLLAGNFVTNWAVSPDGKYFYFTTGNAEPKAQRLRFADRQIESITSLKDLRRVVDSVEQSTQIDIAPDDSPIFARRHRYP